MEKQFFYAKKLSLSDAGDNSPLTIAIVVDRGMHLSDGFVALLSGEERLQLQAQRTPEAKNSFCLGKIAAKTAVQLWLDREIEITITHGVFGFPLIKPSLGAAIISLAHTKNTGIAICSHEKYPIGIDMEEISAQNNAVISSVLTEEELVVITGDELAKTLRLHIYWSAREALSKALKTGFLIPLELLSIKHVIQRSNYVEIAFMHFSLFTGLTFCLGDYIVSIVVPTKVDIDTEFIDDLRSSYSSIHLSKCKEAEWGL